VTFFDALTVTCFVVLVGSFFLWTDQAPRTLMNFLLCGIVFAVANQVGNAESIVLGGILVAAGIGYALLAVRK
jgi:hypothetical protein